MRQTITIEDHELDMIIASVLLKGEFLYREISKFNSKTRKKGNGRLGKNGEMISHYLKKKIEYESLLSKLRQFHNSR